VHRSTFTDSHGAGSVELYPFAPRYTGFSFHQPDDRVIRCYRRKLTFGVSEIHEHVGPVLRARRPFEHGNEARPACAPEGRHGNRLPGLEVPGTTRVEPFVAGEQRHASANVRLERIHLCGELREFA